MVVFSKELAEPLLVCQFKGALAQGPILHLHNHKAQDRVYLLDLMSNVGGHAGDLQAIPC